MAAKYRSITEDESLLQRFKDSGGDLDAQRKAEAELFADNWIDRHLADWEQASIAVVGAIPPQIEEIAEMVATARFIALEFGLKSGDKASQQGSVSHSLMKEALAVVNEIQARGFILGADGQRIYRDNPHKRGGIQVEIGP